ncbi:hypothetical protein F1559_001324 [Cyanidiococcus yangmingshanensis]|uniref:Uncharacterized protein n=1 Tax=Cyanidiococcus yangmingshanensis TaxID=2690220 RepID=A0A7J7IK47_9RHOD|nr:hypothetical protein F1559_001324 [Cyanidiococcus yangmingshanensis]
MPDDALVQAIYQSYPSRSFYVMEERIDSTVTYDIPELMDEACASFTDEQYGWFHDQQTSILNDAGVVIQWVYWWESETHVRAPRKRSWIRRLWHRLAVNHEMKKSQPWARRMECD